MSNIIILPPIKVLVQDKPLPPSKHTARRKQIKKKPRIQNAQWFFFKNYRWIPLDSVNHGKLENAILSKGTFVDIRDSHFPKVPKVRVFPELDYLSYLGIRYRISKVLLPDEE